MPQVLALMVDFDEEEDPAEWANTDEEEDVESDSNPVAGENAIDRLSCALGGQTMMPHILATVPPMLQNRKRDFFLRWIFCVLVGIGWNRVPERVLSFVFIVTRYDFKTVRQTFENSNYIVFNEPRSNYSYTYL